MSVPSIQKIWVTGAQKLVDLINLWVYNTIFQQLLGEKMAKANPKNTTYVYPFKKVPKGQKIDFSKIRNPLDPKKLARPTVKTLAESVNELEQNPAVILFINGLKANKKHFDPKLIGKVVNSPIGNIFFSETTQRLLDTNHCYDDILTKLDPRLLSPVFATKQKDGSLSCFDTQHGITIVGLLAKHGLWGNDSKDWENFKFPTFVVDEPHPSFTPEAALHRNGKGQKKWEVYDHHKIKVADVRQFNNPTHNKEYTDAEARQSICEEMEAIPLPKGHQDFGKAGTLPRTDVIYDWSHPTLRFILGTHKTYWHGTLVDSAAWGLYGNLIEHMDHNGFPTKGTAWKKFLDDFHATISECFTDLAGLRTATERAFTKYHKSAYPNLKNVPSCPNNAALAIVLKIYRNLGGNYYLPGDVNDFTYNGDDIYNHLDQEILDSVKNAKP